MLAGNMCHLCGLRKVALKPGGMKKDIPVYICMKCDVHPKLGPQHLLGIGDKEDGREEP